MSLSSLNISPIGIVPTGNLGITAPVLTSTSQLPATKSGLGKAVGTVGTVANIANSIIGAETISNTIGAVLKNGFDFSCWGSSRNPSKSKAELPEQLAVIGQMAQPIFSQTSAANAQRAINAFFDSFYNYDRKSRVWLGTDARDCTKEGLKVSVTGWDTYKNGTIIPAIKAYLDYNNISFTVSKSSFKVVDPNNTAKSVTVQKEFYTLKESSIINSILGDSGTQTQSSGGGLLALGAAFFLVRKMF